MSIRQAEVADIDRSLYFRELVLQAATRSLHAAASV